MLDSAVQEVRNACLWLDGVVEVGAALSLLGMEKHYMSFVCLRAQCLAHHSWHLQSPEYPFDGNMTWLFVELDSYQHLTYLSMALQPGLGRVRDHRHQPPSPPAQKPSTVYVLFPNRLIQDISRYLKLIESHQHTVPSASFPPH